MHEELNRQYRRLKIVSAGNLGSPEVASLIAGMATRAREILQHTEHVALNSATGKRYFSFRGEKQSRPINESLYEDNERDFSSLLDVFVAGLPREERDAAVRATYSVAFSVFAAHDVHDVGRKASATFFEILIGHVLARAIGVNPRKKVRVPESGADLPTDYVFDPGPRSRKMHPPIKTSTRERAVQAWVHQLVLERIFGAGQYRGVLVVASETKRDTRTGEVTEICVPRQLQMFQARVAEMSRVYYLDPPRVYLELGNAFPRVEVKPFGDALSELPELLDAR